MNIVITDRTTGKPINGSKNEVSEQPKQNYETQLPKAFERLPEQVKEIKDKGINVNKIESEPAFEVDTKQEQGGVQGNKIDDFYKDKKEASTENGAGSFSNVENKPIQVDPTADKTVQNTIESYNLKNRFSNKNGLNNRNYLESTSPETIIEENQYAPSVNYPAAQQLQEQTQQAQTKTEYIPKNYVTAEDVVNDIENIKLLADKSQWTDDEKQIVKQILKVAKGPTSAFSPYLKGQYDKFQDALNVYSKLYSKNNIGTAIAGGFWKGSGIQSLLEGTAKVYDTISEAFGGNSDVLKQVEEINDLVNESTNMSSGRKVASGVAEVAGNLALFAAVGDVITSAFSNIVKVTKTGDIVAKTGKGLTALQTSEKFKPILKYLIAGTKRAATFGASEMIQNIGNVAKGYKDEKGNTYTFGNYLKDAGVSSLGGFANGIAQGLTSVGLGNLLSKNTLMTPFKRFVQTTLSSTAGADANILTQYALKKNMTGKELGVRLATAFGWSVLAGAFDTALLSKQSQADYENLVKDAIKKYDYVTAHNDELSEAELQSHAKDIYNTLRTIRAQFTSSNMTLPQEQIDQLLNSIDWLTTIYGNMAGMYADVDVNSEAGAKVVGLISGDITEAVDNAVNDIVQTTNVASEINAGTLADIQQPTTPPVSTGVNAGTVSGVGTLTPKAPEVKKDNPSETKTSKADTQLTETDKADKLSGLAEKILGSGIDFTGNDKLNLGIAAKQIEKVLESEDTTAEAKLKYANSLNKIYEALGKETRVDTTKYQQEAERFNPDTYAKSIGIENWKDLAKQYLGGYTIFDYNNKESFDNLVSRINDAQTVNETAPEVIAEEPKEVVAEEPKDLIQPRDKRLANYYLGQFENEAEKEGLDLTAYRKIKDTLQADDLTKENLQKIVDTLIPLSQTISNENAVSNLWNVVLLAGLEEDGYDYTKLRANNPTTTEVAKPVEASGNPLAQTSTEVKTTEQEYDEAEQKAFEKELEEANTTSIPATENTEEAKNELKKAVKIGVETNNKEAIKYAIETNQLSLDTVDFVGNVEGFNSEQRSALANSLINGIKTDNDKIKTDVPYDGTFEINNNAEAVATVLDGLKVKVRQEAILTNSLKLAIKKLNSKTIYRTESGDIITDGNVLFSIPKDASEYLLNNQREFGKVSEGDKNGLNIVNKYINSKYNEIKSQPTEVSLKGGKSAYSFAKDTSAVFDKNYINIFKNAVYSLSEDLLHDKHWIKAETPDGELLGVLMPLKVAVEDIVSEKPSAIKILQRKTNDIKNTNSMSEDKSVKEEGQNEKTSNSGLSKVPESTSVQQAEGSGETRTKDQGTNGILNNKGVRTERPTSEQSEENGALGEWAISGKSGSGTESTTTSLGNAQRRNGSQDQGYRITELPILEATPVKRFDANIKAIETLNKIESENRLATTEEQELLAQFTGWGGLKSVFNAKTNAEKERSEKLKSLLTTEEYRNAENNGTLTAFYTPINVVKNIYSILKNMGFTKGGILEPSCGTGIFIGAMPESMRSSNINGVEIDPVSGKIAKYLYPNASINVEGFQELNVAKNSMDLVVGNIPYAKNLKVYDKNFNYGGPRDIHDFFMIKGLDVLKEGGVMAVLAPTSIMDEGNKSFVGENISKRAKLVSAFRLPSGTFGNTEVVCDLIILQKRGIGLSDNTIDYQPSGQITVDGVQKTISQYYIDNPEHVLGEFAIKEIGDKRKDLIVKDSGKDLADSINLVPKNIIAKAKESQAIEQVKKETAEPAITDMPNGTIFEKDGKLFGVENGEAVNPFYYQKKKAEVFIDTDGKQTFVDTGKPLLDDNGDQVKRQKRVEIQEGSKDYERIKALNEIANAYTELMSVQEQTEGEDPLVEPRKKLNKAYDRFSKKFSGKNGPGRLNDNKNHQVFSDPRIGMLEALEKKTANGYTKAEVFEKRTINAIKVITSVTNAYDALIASINNTGSVNLNYMSELYGKPIDDIVKELKGSIFELPEEEGIYVVADEYLSGNVKQKLKTAEEKNKNGKYNENVEALKKVIPADLQPADITIRLGNAWIDPSYIEDFIRDLTNMPELNVKVTYIPYNSLWVVDMPYRTNFGKWDTPDKTGLEIIRAALNNQSITIVRKDEYGGKYTDQKATEEVQQKIDDLQEYFAKWAFGKDVDRTTALVKLYNDEMNTTAKRKYDGSFLSMPGSTINLYKTQKNAVYRIMSSPATLLNHAVGAGKTFTMLGAIHEMKRLGIVQKPILIVPNNKIDDFVSDFYKMYPTSKVLAVTSDDWSKASRERMIYQIQSTEYDVIIIRHSSFETFGFSKEYQEHYYQNRISEAEKALEDAKVAGATERQLTSIKKRIESYKAKLDELLDPKRHMDEIIGFDQTGIDAVFVDEAHNFKNLENFTKLDRIPGAGTGDAKKTTRLHMATEYIHERGGKVVFATATPISNTMGEIYNMFRYLRPDILAQYHMPSFDAFASTFGEIITRNEPNTTGTGLVAKKRFAKFVNIPELMTAFNIFNDTVSIENIKKNNPEFKLPKANRINISVESNELLDLWNQFIESEKNRIKGMSPEELKEEGINNLLLYGDAKMGALDMRMVAKILKDKGYLPYYAQIEDLDFAGSKINKLVDKIYSYYNKFMDSLGTQLVFLDKGTPQTKMSQKDFKRMSDIRQQERNGDPISEKDAAWYAEILASQRYGFDLYADIKKKLVKKGIPEDQIAFMQDSNTDTKREKLFDAVRNGRIRILLGSTRTLGEGVNVQDKIVAIHHVDAPDRPSDVAQRDGRGERQGNENDSIDILYYSTKNSFDAFAWDALDKKQSFISSVTSEGVEREHEDVDEVDFGNLSLEAANNPLFKEKADLQNKIKKVEAKKRNIQNDTYERDRILQQNTGKIATMNQEILYLESAKERADANQDIKAKFGKTEIEGYKAISEKIEELAKNLETTSEPRVIGEFRGLNITVSRAYNTDNAFFVFGNTFKIGLSLGNSVQSVVWIYANTSKEEENNYPFSSVAKRLDNQINKLNEQIDGKQKSRDYLQQAYDNAKKTVIEPFTDEQEAELSKDKARLKEITTELGNIGSANVLNPFNRGMNTMDIVQKIHGNGRSQVIEAMMRGRAEINTSKPRKDTSDTAKIVQAMLKGKEKQKPVPEVQKMSGDLFTPKAPTPKSDATKVESYDDIAREMFKHFGVALVRGGNFRKKSADGYYERGRATVRTKDQNSLYVDSHELGHHFDRKYALSDRFATELEKVAEQFDFRTRESYNNDKEKLKREALAEFVRLYLVNPAGAEEFVDGTDFYTEFEKAISSEDKKALKDFGGRIRTIIGADSVVRAKSTIRHYGEKKKDIRTIQDKIDDAYTTLVDENYPIKVMVDKVEKLSGKKIEPHRDSYILAKQLDKGGAIANDMIKNGLHRPNNYERVSKSMQEILAPVKKHMEDFNVYLKTKDALDLYQYGKKVFPNDFSEQDLSNMVVELDQKYPEFEATSNELYQYWEDFERMWLVDTGHISNTTFEMLRALYPHYVPKFRFTDKSIAKNGKQGGNALKRMSYKGSDLETYAATESFMYEMDRIVRAEMRRQINLQIRNLYNDPDPDIAEAVSMFIAKDNTNLSRNIYDARIMKSTLENKMVDDIVKNLSTEQQRKLLKGTLAEKQQVIKEANLEVATDVIENYIDNFIEYYTPKKSANGEDQIIIPMAKINEETGEDYDSYEVYRVIDPALYNALANRNTHELHGIIKILAGWRRAFTALTTGSNPLFALTSNIWRDAGQAFVMGESGNPLQYTIDWAKAIVDIVKKSDMYLAYKSMGGSGESIFSEGRDYFATYESKNAVQKAIRTLIAKVEDFNDLVETAPRLAEFKRVVKEEGLKGRSEEDALLLGARAGAELTTDFSQRGSSEVLDSIVGVIPFSRAGINGLDNLYKAFSGNFTRDSKKSNAEKSKIIMNTIAKAVISLTIPTIILAILHRNDEEYNKLPEFYKQNYWIFNKEKITRNPEDKGKFIRIPKPRELGWLFSSTLESAFFELVDAEDDNGKALISSFIDTFIPSFDTVFAPFVDAARNTTWSGGTIVSESFDELMKGGYFDQVYDDTTSRIAVVIAKLLPDIESLGVINTPKGIDYILKQTTGVFGQILLPVFTPSDEGLLSSLRKKNMVDTTYSNKYVDLYYNIKNLQSGAREANDTKVYDENMYNLFNKTSKDIIEQSIENGVSIPEDSILRELMKYKNVSEKGTVTYGIAPSKRLSMLWGEIREYNNDRSLTKTERKEKIMEARKEINEISQAMVEVYRQYTGGDVGELEAPASRYYNEAVEIDYADSDNALLPTKLDTAFETSNKTIVQLTASQYEQYQQDYEDNYWRYVDKNFGLAKNNVEKAAILKASKTVARERAKNNIINNSTDYFDKFKGSKATIKDEDLIMYKAKVDVANDDKSLKQEDYISIIESLNLNGYESYLLFHSKYESDKNNPWRAYKN